MHADLIPLDLLGRGEWAEVANVEGEPGAIARLAALGIRPGAVFRMLQPGSPCLFQVGATRLSLRGENESLEILVRPLAAPAELAVAG